MLSSGGETFPNLTGNPDYGTTGFPLLGSATILGIPLTIWLLIVVGVVAAYIAARTPLGRQIYAIGSNERAAQLSGVRVNRVKMFVYMFSGLCATIVGLIISSELVASHPMSGETFELNAIAAAVLGGTSMSGGTARSAARGAAPVGDRIASDGLVMMGVSGRRSLRACGDHRDHCLSSIRFSAECTRLLHFRSRPRRERERSAHGMGNPCAKVSARFTAH